MVTGEAAERADAQGLASAAVDKAWRALAFPALVLALLLWFVGWHNVGTQDYQHETWRCGAVWGLLVDHDAPTLQHIDLTDNGDPVTPPNVRAASSDCRRTARDDATVEGFLTAIGVLWFAIAHRRWKRAEARAAELRRART